MDNALVFQHKCTETEQMNIQMSFSPSHGKEIRLGGLGTKLVECVSFCSGKALHQRNNPFWIPSQVHGQNMSDEEVSWRTPLPSSTIAFLYTHTYTLTVLYTLAIQNLFLSSIYVLLPACGLPVISERRT